MPVNLARLQAAIAHFNPQGDDYHVKVLCAGSLEEAARLVRTFAEEVHRGSRRWEEEEEEWLDGDVTREEVFLLLSFPCINAFR